MPEETPNSQSEVKLINPELPPSVTEFPRESIPIKKENYDNFKTWFCQTPEDEELFKKIWQNIRFIDQGSFEEGIRKMTKAIMSFVGEDDYYLVVDNPGKSGDLMLEKLDLTERLPTGIIRFQDFEKTDFLPQGFTKKAKLVIVDDASYSGDRINNLALNPATQIFNQDRIFVTAVAMTDRAITRTKEQGIGDKQIYCVYRVPFVRDVLTEEEIDHYYQKKTASQGGFGEDRSSYDSRVLTFFYYKVPDNFLFGFRRMRPITIDIGKDYYDEVFLLDDTRDTNEGIIPPYWKKRY